MNLRVENNNKFVRGKKKTRESIEKYLNYYYGMQKSPSINDDYIIFVKYKDDDLKNVVYEIFRESLYGFNHPSHYGDVRKINCGYIPNIKKIIVLIIHPFACFLRKRYKNNLKIKRRKYYEPVFKNSRKDKA